MHTKCHTVYRSFAYLFSLLFIEEETRCANQPYTRKLTIYGMYCSPYFFGEICIINYIASCMLCALCTNKYPGKKPVIIFHVMYLTRSISAPCKCFR
jgi:hypothetical protein